MDCPRVGGTGDDPIEGIDLADEMTLAEAPNRRVAAHRANGLEIEADKRHARTHARGDGRRLDAGVTAADYDDVEVMHDCPPLAQPCFT